MSNASILLREASSTDLPAILEIYNHAILHTTSVYQYQPQTLEMRRVWFEEKQSKNLPVLVACIENRVVGFASYGPFRAWPAYKYTAEHMVYVHPDFRRLGIARKLMEEIISLAQKNQLHVLIAGVDSNNDISIQLHKSLGFTEVARFNQVGYKFGKWLDLVFMQRTFDTPQSPNEENP
ncbi:MAG: N-acetyltransferase family protein [Flavobacteriales bacterium]